MWQLLWDFETSGFKTLEFSDLERFGLSRLGFVLTLGRCDFFIYRLPPLPPTHPALDESMPPIETFARFQAGFLSSDDFHCVLSIFIGFHRFL